MREIAALSKEQFRNWPLERREAYLKEHPNSKFHYHELLERKKVKLPEKTPKLGTNWAEHSRFPDPDHHRRHAKAHTIAANAIMEKAKKYRSNTPVYHGMLEEAANRLKWKERHEKLYKKLADDLLK